MNGSGSSSSVWPTVIVQDSKQTGHAESGPGQAEKLSFVAALWPTARVSDIQGGRPLTEDGRRVASTGAVYGLQLSDHAEMLWPTPMAGTPARNGNSAAGNSDFSRRADELAAGLWATPRSANIEENPQTYAARALWDHPGGRQWPGMPLGTQVQLWATPASRDHKGENSVAHVGSAPGRAHMDQLPNQVAHGFLSPLPARMTATDGPPCSTWRPISRRLFRSAMSAASPAFTRRMSRKGAWRRRRLNPAFVEWLMLWPEGHALSGSSETAFTRWLLRSRGALSRLPSASGPWIWEEAAMPEQIDLFGETP